MEITCKCPGHEDRRKEVQLKMLAGQIRGQAYKAVKNQLPGGMEQSRDSRRSCIMEYWPEKKGFRAMGAFSISSVLTARNR